MLSFAETVWIVSVLSQFWGSAVLSFLSQKLVKRKIASLLGTRNAVISLAGKLQMF